MKKFRPSLSVMLISAFAFTSAMPVMVMTAWLYHGVQDSVWREARDKNQLLSRNISGPVYQYLSAAQNNLGLLATLIGATDGYRRLAPEILAQTYFSEIALLSPDGKAGEWLRPSADHAGAQALGKVAGVRRLLSTHVPGHTGVVRDPATGQPTVFFAQPAGKMLLLGALNMEPIRKIQENIHFGKLGHCAIVDQYGNVVAHPNPKWMAQMKSLAAWPIVKSGLQGHTGVMTFYSPFIKANMIAGYASVPRFGWVVLTPQPLSELTNQADKLVKSGILFGSFGLVVSLVIGGFLAKWVARPLGTLVEGVKRIQEDDYSGQFRPLGSVAPKEVETLRDYAIHMTDSIRQAMAFRDNANRELGQKIRQATGELVALNTRLARQAYTDDLTKLRNRRALWEKLSDFEKAGHPWYLPLQVMLFDVDKFKPINDTFGHEVGDRVLAHVARTIEAHTREGDFVVRYGGDEFLVVMPNCDLESATRRAEAIRENVVSSPLTVDGKVLGVTLSIGIADWDSRGTVPNFSDLLRAADKAMYLSKKNGRNRVSSL